MEMLRVETIRNIHLTKRDGKAIRKIAQDSSLSRNTVRKALRSKETAFRYDRCSPVPCSARSLKPSKSAWRMMGLPKK